MLQKVKYLRDFAQVYLHVWSIYSCFSHLDNFFRGKFFFSARINDFMASLNKDILWKGNDDLLAR